MTRAHPHDAVSLLRELIVCESVTPADAGALDTLGDFLDAAGFEVNQMVFSAPGTPDIANLFAKFGSGSPHLSFAGHTDVVPAGDAVKWSHPPFSGAIADGVLFGRGAADMKGAIAAFAVAARDYLADRGAGFSGTVSLLITGDEEGPAINGTAKLLDWCARRGETFDAALVGEPTNPGTLGDMIKIGRRGSLTGRLTVHGVQGHVAYPDRAENPVRGLLRLVDALLDPPFDAGSDHFQPSNLEVTSVDVGNPATNVIPAEARAVFNIRFADLWTPESIEAEIRARLEQASGNAVRYELAIDRPVGPAFLTAPGPFVDMLIAAIEAETGRRPELSTTGGTSDARFIKDYCPVVEFGLVGATMHQIDERVEIADIARLTRIYRGVLERYFG